MERGISRRVPMKIMMADPSSIAKPRDGVILAIFTPMAAMILYLVSPARKKKNGHDRTEDEVMMVKKKRHAHFDNNIHSVYTYVVYLYYTMFFIIHHGM